MPRLEQHSNNIITIYKILTIIVHELLKGTQLGPLLALISPWFRENVIVTLKIVSFLCSFFLMALIWKKGYFWPTFHIFFLSPGKRHTKILQHISHLHTYTYFAHPIDFFALPMLQKIRINHVWFLFGVTPGVDSFSRHFGALNKQQNLDWNVYYWCLLTLMQNV